MLKHLCLTLVGLLGAMALGLGPARAGDERLPLAGNPALVINVPDGWSASRDGSGNLIVLAADHSGDIVMSVVTMPDAGTANLDDVAAQALTAAKATPYSRSEDATIAGQAAKAYYSTITNAAGVAVQLRLVLTRMDATHLASESELNVANATPAQIQAVYALSATVRIEGD